ncbi:hypothetical protein Bbelb_148410 [Branchiostoma belcheri]|nr:hypothetical protein Bbelb_148410 [Branchiostoma belcheri]
MSAGFRFRPSSKNSSNHFRGNQKPCDVTQARRLITGHKLQDHVSAVNLRAEAGIDSVRKRTEITTLVNVFKAIRGGAPVYMSSLFNKSHGVQEQSTVLWSLPVEHSSDTATTAPQSQDF